MKTNSLKYFYYVIAKTMTYLEELSLQTGYEPKTDLWDRFNQKSTEGLVQFIKDEWQKYKDMSKEDLLKEENYVRLTELSMLTNWKARETADANEDIATDLTNVWIKLHDWCGNHLKKEAGTYYYRTTD